MDKQRLDYFDYVKAIGILMIVFEHVVQYFNVFSSINKFTNFRVSIFFFISGGLFFYTKSKNLSFKQYLNKKFQSLIIPYIIFSIINSVMKLGVLAIVHKLSLEGVQDEAKAFFITGNGTVWFLLTLFLVDIIFYQVSKIENDYINLIFATVGLIVPFLVGTTYNAFAIVLLRVFLGLWYYIIGYYFMKMISDKNISIYAGIILVVLGVALSFNSGLESYFTGSYNKIVFTVPSNIFSIVGWVLIFKNVNIKIKWLSYVGKNSLVIMLVHPIILLFFTYPFAKTFLLLGFSTQLLVGTSLFFIVMLLNIPCIFIINNYLLFLIGKKVKKELVVRNQSF